MIVLLFGSKLGWASLPVLALTVVAAAAWAAFVQVERKKLDPFIDFSLFRNTTFTGATISNFLLNGTIGMLIVSQQLIQLAGHKSDGELYSAWDAGLLTIGYGVTIIAFIRVGEKLLQKFGPRKPMICTKSKGKCSPLKNGKERGCIYSPDLIEAGNLTKPSRLMRY
jgi:DHA2 family multidrug resistance protein-like MFS transporter